MADQVLTDTFFEQFDLHPTLAQGLADCGFTRCTPIQALTLPVALTGRDVAGQAQTGTGKTAAFLVAVFNRLLTRPALAERRPEDPRALILAPTRELAIQIEKDARAIGRHTGLRLALIYGGTDYDRQRELLKSGCDVIIATPGRLIDYFKQQVFTLRAVDAMVVDEADRMFDLGFIKDIYFLFRRLPPREQRQSMLFSATLSQRVLELAYEHMNEPEKLAVESEHITADRVRQRVYFPAKEEKIPLLLNLLQQADTSRSIVFVNTKIAAERVTERLQRQGILAGTLSGDVPQKKREKLLARFQQGQLEALVATDVAARGLHIEGVSHVFNYDLPQDAEDYVHRIGRTARLGAAGDAVSFACDLYAVSLPDIETYIGQKIPVATVSPELLIAPKPRRSAAQMAAHAGDDAEGEADAAGVGVATRSSTPRTRQRGPRSSTPRRAERSVEQRAAPLAVAPAPVAAAAAGAVAGDAMPRKRRRRGGRGRRHEVEASKAAVAAAAPSAASTHVPAMRRHEPRTPAHSGEPGAAHAHAPKPGFLRRIARLFRKR
ncbi:MAG: DEAD/DEAH box helicase [Proteobacteria bacterium]|jgi:ATP-dependent RNA helicase RhlB|nr:DEAD/DEAH box helicase [Pseudomonadota bacterium]